MSFPSYESNNVRYMVDFLERQLKLGNRIDTTFLDWLKLQPPSMHYSEALQKWKELQNN